MVVGGQGDQPGLASTRRLNCQNLCPVLLGWAPGGFPGGVCGFPPPPWVVGALGIRPTCPPSAPGRTSHNSPGHRATRRRVVGACQGCAPPPPRPCAPSIGTQAGPLPAGLAGGSHAGRLRRFPRASKSEIQPRHNLHSRQPREGKQRRILVMAPPSGSQRKYNDRLSVTKRKALAAREGELFPVTCT